MQLLDRFRGCLLGLATGDAVGTAVEFRSRGNHESDIRGSGYVVDSLEAALWCFAETSSFESAILRAANLGDDADTTAAVCGQVAGAYFGEVGIPSTWLDQLAMRKEIVALAERLRSRADGVAAGRK